VSAQSDISTVNDSRGTEQIVVARLKETFLFFGDGQHGYLLPSVLVAPPLITIVLLRSGVIFAESESKKTLASRKVW
jgi:hypothetical protein